jgi:iron(II)-dependent oxidoreductase
MEEQANTRETGIEETSVVGIFPRGKSLYGVMDVVGNVWEWTKSRWGRGLYSSEYSYPYDPDDGRESLEGVMWRVVRGGSWHMVNRNTRCAFRFRFLPDLVYFDLGFRVVIPMGI